MKDPVREGWRRRVPSSKNLNSSGSGIRKKKRKKTRPERKKENAMEVGAVQGNAMRMETAFVAEWWEHP